MDERQRDAVNITSARFGHSVDIRQRQKRYLVSMLIRTVCFVSAVITTGPVRWVFVAAAIFLPYVAVVFANNGSQKAPQDADVVTPEPIGEVTDGHPDRQ